MLAFPTLECPLINGPADGPPLRDEPQGETGIVLTPEYQTFAP